MDKANVVVGNSLYVVLALPQMLGLVAYLVYRVGYPDGYFYAWGVDVGFYVVVGAYWVVNVVQFGLFYRVLR